MAITSSGIGSGIDIESLVTKLVAAEGQGKNAQLNKKEATLTADLSAYGNLKGALSAFQTTVRSLNDPADFLSRTAKSSNEDLFTVAANEKAAAGSYNIQIEQLAQAEKLRSIGFVDGTASVVGTGTLALSVGSHSFELTIDESNNTLAGIRDAINAASDNKGITASIIQVDGGAQLVLTSADVGASNTISVVATDDDGADGNDLARLSTANLVTVDNAQDAIIHIDNQKVTRGSNNISDVLTGVTFDLKGAEPGTTATLAISLDKSSISKNVKKFVDAYNSLASTMTSLSSYNAKTGAAGTLLGDSALRGVESQIRQTMTSAISGLGVSTLVDIGVTTDDEGNLEVNEKKLNDVINQDFDAVSQLFSSKNGLAKQLDSVLERYIAADTGILDSRTGGLQANIDSIAGEREQLSRRLESIEKRYRAQFTAMDITVAQLNSTGTYLTQQLEALTKLKKK